MLIVLVEDEPTVRMNYSELLELEGYHVQSYSNGEEAITGLTRFDKVPDLIISDIAMPVMNGIELIQELQKLSRFRLVPFVFLTAKSSREDIRMGMNLGADDFLVKPCDRQQLLSCVETRKHKHELINQLVQARDAEVRTTILKDAPIQLQAHLEEIVETFQQLSDLATQISDLSLQQREQELIYKGLQGTSKLFAWALTQKTLIERKYNL